MKHKSGSVDALNVVSCLEEGSDFVNTPHEDDANSNLNYGDQQR
jgi:hypothetical protein